FSRICSLLQCTLQLLQKVFVSIKGQHSLLIWSFSKSSLQEGHNSLLLCFFLQYRKIISLTTACSFILFFFIVFSIFSVPLSQSVSLISISVPVSESVGFQFCIGNRPHCFDKIKHVKQPHCRKNCPSHGDSTHKPETNPHKKSHGCHNGHFC